MDGKKKHYLEVHVDQLKLFYGTSIAALLPPPTPIGGPAKKAKVLTSDEYLPSCFLFQSWTFLWAERNTWRQIYQDMADGLPSRQPLRPPGRVKLFWTRDNAHREDD